MARMSVDDSVARDPRITKLAKAVGWSRRETVGCLILDVWPICYDQRESVIAVDLVDLAAAADGFAAAMVESGLATWVRGNRRVRIRGAQERIEYLSHRRESGRVGGIKSGESRNKNSSTASAGAEARGNPSVPDPSSASVPVSSPVPEEKKGATPTAGVSDLAAFKLVVDEKVAERAARKPRTPKPPVPGFSEARAFWFAFWKRRSGGQDPQWTGRQAGQLSDLLKLRGLDEFKRRVDLLEASRDTWHAKWDFALFASSNDQLIAATQSKTTVGRAEPKSPEAYVNDEGVTF